MLRLSGYTNAARHMACLVLLVLVACCVSAQEFRASLQGTITDPSGAVVPNAELTLRNSETGVERTGSADGVGHYLFSLVPPGKYSLTAKAAGFKTFTRDGVTLNVSQNAQLDIEVPVGAAADTVSVSADLVGVETQSSSLGGALTEAVIANLPLKGHNSLTLYNMAPGVDSDRTQDDVRPNDATYSTGIRVNGAPNASEDVAIDGVSNLVNLNRGTIVAAWVPSTDAVAEFKLQTGTLPAQYGFSAGAISNIVIKSGTNDLHGSGFEFFRNNVLNANLFFSNRVGQPLQPFTYHTFGGSIGGPIYIPRTYNGRNRSFFFFNYEGARQADPWNAVSTVPTLKMHSGDFSETKNQIYDPFSVHMVNGVPTRDAFSGNIIPKLVQDPVGQKIMSYYIEPNAPGASASSPWVGNYSYSSTRPRAWDYYTIKLDQQFGPRNQAFLRVNAGNSTLDFGHQWDGIATSGATYTYRPQRGVSLSDTHTFNARTIMDIRLGFGWGQEKEIPWSYGFDLTSLGLPASYTSLVQRDMFPGISMSSFTGLSGQAWQEQPGYTWTLQGSVSRSSGKHLIKTGAEMRVMRGNYYSNNAPSGSFSFGTSWTGGPRADTPASNSGFAPASLLLGVGSGNISTNTSVSIQNLLYAFYVQDDYRLSSRLTLNYGLRYEFAGPMTERYDRNTRGWAYNTPSPLQVPGLNLTGGLVYAGVNGQPRGDRNPDRNNVAPRFGFSYSVSKNTVLRGGYALFYIPIWGGSIQSLGFSVDTPLTTSTDGINVKNRVSNPFPDGLLTPVGNSQGLGTLLGQSVSFVEPADPIAPFHSWNVNIQRQLPSSTLVEIGYVGTRGYNLLGSSQQLNQLDPSYLSMGSALLQPVPNPFYGIISSGSLSGATVQRQQLLLPYPQFTSVSRLTPAYGNSIYHGLQLRLDKRMKQGLNGVLTYTFSKNITDVNSAQNAYDRQWSRAVGATNAGMRLNFMLLWEMPFGRGRHFLRAAPRALDLLVGGWSLSTSGNMQAGFPVSFGLNSSTIFAANARQVPNVVGDPAAGVSGSIGSRLNNYFNTSAFAQPANFTFGNVGPRTATVCVPGITNNNLVMSKIFSVTERVKVEFRGSAYNFLNHTQFLGPGTSLGNASFGIISGQANVSREIEFTFRLSF